MNGRVYDYNTGRFMSVDPYIQGSGNSQGINPYSYIMNNPLAGTDPTGYKIELTGSKIKVDESSLDNVNGTATVGGSRVSTSAGVSRSQKERNHQIQSALIGLAPYSNGAKTNSEDTNSSSGNPMEIGGEDGRKKERAVLNIEGSDTNRSEGLDSIIDAGSSVIKEITNIRVDTSKIDDDWVVRVLLALKSQGRMAAGGLQIGAGKALCKVTGCILGPTIMAQGAGNVGGGVSDYLAIFGVESNFNLTEILYEKLLPGHGKEVFLGVDILSGVLGMRGALDDVPAYYQYGLTIQKPVTVPRFMVDGTPVWSVINGGVQIGAALDSLGEEK